MFLIFKKMSWGVVLQPETHLNHNLNKDHIISQEHMHTPPPTPACLMVLQEVREVSAKCLDPSQQRSLGNSRSNSLWSMAKAKDHTNLITGKWQMASTVRLGQRALMPEPPIEEVVPNPSSITTMVSSTQDHFAQGWRDRAPMSQTSALTCAN